MRELSRGRCLELLASARVGRVGVSVRALPVVLPVSYRLDGERVVFRTVPGTKLDAAVHRSVVAFETDAYDPDGVWGWSVLVQGVASEITNAAELARVRRLLAGTWAFLDEDSAGFVAVEPTFISGRAFAAPPGR